MHVAWELRVPARSRRARSSSCARPYRGCAGGSSVESRAAPRQSATPSSRGSFPGRSACRRATTRTTSSARVAEQTARAEAPRDRGAPHGRGRPTPRSRRSSGSRRSAGSYVYGPEIAPNGEAPERARLGRGAPRGPAARGARRAEPGRSRAKAIEEAILRVARRRLARADPRPPRLPRAARRGRPGDGTRRGRGAALHASGSSTSTTRSGTSSSRSTSSRSSIGQKNRRPDILLFVNGLPLGQLELKDPGERGATPVGAGEPGRALRRDDPAPLPLRRARRRSPTCCRRGVGTITTPAEHFAEWKTMDPAESEGRSQLERADRGRLRAGALPRPRPQLRPLRGVEARSSRRSWPSTTRSTPSTARSRRRAEAMAADGRAGVVWHTQGSGKSYTMVFYARKLRRDPRFENPTIVALTDRTDLDTQLHETFARAARRSRRRSSRRSRSPTCASGSTGPAGGIVFTTIQKFAAPERAEMPVLSTRANVIVMADEAHRTQYDRLAAQHRPSRCRTRRGSASPGRRSRRATARRSSSSATTSRVYRMERAVEDGATVPIYYESRRIPLDVKDEDAARARSRRRSTGEEDEAAGEAVARVDAARAHRRHARAARAGRRRHRRALPARARRRSGGKAMVVAMSQRIAAELDRAPARSGSARTPSTCVISASATDDPAISQLAPLGAASASRSRPTSRIPTTRCGSSSCATCG